MGFGSRLCQVTVERSIILVIVNMLCKVGKGIACTLVSILHYHLPLSVGNYTIMNTKGVVGVHELLLNTVFTAIQRPLYKKH